MSNNYTSFLHEGNILYILPGRRFTVKELTSRLHEMDIDFDNTQKNKNYLIDKYDSAIKYSANRIKILERIRKDTKTIKAKEDNDKKDNASIKLRINPEPLNISNQNDKINKNKIDFDVNNISDIKENDPKGITIKLGTGKNEMGIKKMSVNTNPYGESENFKDEKEINNGEVIDNNIINTKTNLNQNLNIIPPFDYRNYKRQNALKNYDINISPQEEIIPETNIKSKSGYSIGQSTIKRFKESFIYKNADTICSGLLYAIIAAIVFCFAALTFFKRKEILKIIKEILKISKYYLYNYFYLFMKDFFTGNHWQRNIFGLACLIIIGLIILIIKKNYDFKKRIQNMFNLIIKKLKEMTPDENGRKCISENALYNICTEVYKISFKEFINTYLKELRKLRKSEMCLKIFKEKNEKNIEVNFWEYINDI